MPSSSINQPRKREVEHAKSMKAALRAAFPEEAVLVEEFIKDQDPDYQVSNWKKYRTNESLFLAFNDWRGLAQQPTGAPTVPAPVAPAPVAPAPVAPAPVAPAPSTEDMQEQFSELALEIHEFPQLPRTDLNDIKAKAAALQMRFANLVKRITG